MDKRARPTRRDVDRALRRVVAQRAVNLGFYPFPVGICMVDDVHDAVHKRGVSFIDAVNAAAATLDPFHKAPIEY
jgi:hypothetical protein